MSLLCCFFCFVLFGGQEGLPPLMPEIFGTLTSCERLLPGNEGLGFLHISGVKFCVAF